MPPPKDLPGFYFDTEKNRYFPIKGPIPGSKRRSSSSPSSSSTPSSRDADQKHQLSNACRRKRMKSSELLHVREIHGSVLFSNKCRYNFRKEYQKVQASQPVVWKYRRTKSLADSAIEQLHGVVQTPNGTRDTKFLTTGSTNGIISLFEIGNVLGNLDTVTESLPEPVWSSAVKHKALLNSALGSIWCTEAFSSLPSNISSIKRCGSRFPDPANANLSFQQALVTTLGSGVSSGSLYLLNLGEPLDFAVSLHSRISNIASFDCTVWTADCNSSGTQAVIGTNFGSVLVNLETRAASWLYHCKSDIFSLQFVQSGNVVLCGLRNGAIVSIDMRQKQPGYSDHSFGRPLPGRPNAHRTFSLSQGMVNRPGKQRIQINRKLNTSNIVFMPSAVCSLVSLLSDEHYFLGSSMDGSIKLFDRRLLQRGALQSYEGHVNSHTHLQLAVNPAETLLLSGGEDHMVRIWSINNSELIFAENVANSIFSTVCWPQSSNDLGFQGLLKQPDIYSVSPFELSQSWGAWLGSQDGLFYMHGT
ncbi:uncharacterized protein [Typha latifolia]|uniref:uncharacterized protein isoform X2 n=1 Tax=Typha latifolia TaxID=4733 RepID=UPI003C2B0F56